MSLNFGPSVNNITVDGLTISGANINASTNVTVKNASMGPTVVNTTKSAMDVLLDRDRWVGTTCDLNSYEGRVRLTGSSASPNGVTIRNQPVPGRHPRRHSDQRRLERPADRGQRVQRHQAERLRLPRRPDPVLRRPRHHDYRQLLPRQLDRDHVR
jgi:hypothetical protein